MDTAPLTATTVARRADTTPARIRRLVSIGVLHPDPQGRFSVGDIQRVRIVEAYERSGIELDHLARAIREGRMSFEFTDRIYPEASALSGRTLGDLMLELGPVGALLPDVLLALGQARSAPDRVLTEAEEATLRLFMTAWSTEPLDAGTPLRAARLVGDAARRIAEGWVKLFLEAIALEPGDIRSMTLDELRPRMFEPAIRVAGALEPTLIWLLRRHLEQALNAVNVESMEQALEDAGERPRVDREPPAIVFADLSGFTRLTEVEGDEAAVRHADGLARMAVGVAATWDGRLVKQLGDGVMLAFERAADAIEAAVELRRAAATADLPALHVGVSAGPVVERDGDYYGRTVNLAARLSGAAGPGEIVLNDVAARAVARERTTRLEPATLKGFTTPVPIFRLEVEAPARPDPD